MHINKKIKAATKNAPRGFAPAAVAPRNAIAPEQVIGEYRKRRGGEGTAYLQGAGMVREESWWILRVGTGSVPSL